MIIRAIFIGAHGSMGYSKGSYYRLRIERNTIYPIGNDQAKPCPYTLEGFLANWEIKEVEQLP